MKDIINILVSSDTNFLPILGVMLHSLVTERSNERQLTVHLLCHRDSLDSVMLDRLDKQLRCYERTDLRIVDVSAIADLSRLHLGLGYVTAIYYRLLAPVLLPHLDKVLYLDCDLIIQDDITKLYDAQLGDNLVAACIDTDIVGHMFAPVNNLKEYMLNLGIRDTSGYFNSGMLLMNLKRMRDEALTEQMIEFVQAHNCHFPDQDVLNFFCQGRVLYMSKAWNSHQLAKVEPQARYAPNAEWKSFLAGCADEKIIHYTITKPWNDLGVSGADVWWQCARQTQWHELLLQRLALQQSQTRSATEEADAALRRVYSSDWLRGNLTELMRWNETHVYAALVDLAHEREAEREVDDANLERLRSSRTVFYGAGYWCRCFLEFFDMLGMDYPAEIWDIGAKNLSPRLHGIPVREPDFDSLGEGALVAITVQDGKANSDVQGKCNNALTHSELKAALARALWIWREEMNYSL